MSDYVRSTMKLTDAAVLQMLDAAVSKAKELGQPQCIIIVDASGEVLGEFRMDEAKYLSRKSARAKARTAASIGAPSAAIPETVRPLIALATEGDVTGLGGGLPIGIDGVLLGGIGVGSGTPDQDLAVASAALSAIGVESAG